MELFGCKLDRVLSFNELDELSNSEISPRSDDDSDFEIISNFAYQLSMYISFLNSKPKITDFIPSFQNKPYIEKDVREHFSVKYPNDKNRVIKETLRARLGSGDLVKFEGWKLIHYIKNRVHISNGYDVILFNLYEEGENPHHLYKGEDIKNYLHLVEHLGLVLKYKTN